MSPKKRNFPNQNHLCEENNENYRKGNHTKNTKRPEKKTTTTQTEPKKRDLMKTKKGQKPNTAHVFAPFPVHAIQTLRVQKDENTHNQREAKHSLGPALQRGPVQTSCGQSFCSFQGLRRSSPRHRSTLCVKWLHCAPRWKKGRVFFPDWSNLPRNETARFNVDCSPQTDIGPRSNVHFRERSFEFVNHPKDKVLDGPL